MPLYALIHIIKEHIVFSYFTCKSNKVPLNVSSTFVENGKFQSFIQVLSSIKLAIGNKIIILYNNQSKEEMIKQSVIDLKKPLKRDIKEQQVYVKHHLNDSTTFGSHSDGPQRMKPTDLGNSLNVSLQCHHDIDICGFE